MKTFKKISERKEGGFALLFSVLLSSLLLTIGLSIFSIALKELAISTASRQSIYAFYASASGLEYALYHDTKVGDLVPGFDPNSPEAQDKPGDYSAYISGVTGPNYVIEARKSKPAGSVGGGSKINTVITSIGYDSDGSDRVERQMILRN